MSKKQKQPKGTKVTKEIEFALTEQEFSEKGKQAAKFSKAVANLNVEFEEVKDTWKSKIKSAEAKRDELLAAINAKKEKRTVETVMVKDYNSKEIQYWFEGKVVEARTMTDAELQVEADFTKMEKQARGVRQRLQTPPPKPNGKDNDLAQVMKEETNRRTKSSAVDGPVQ